MPHASGQSLDRQQRHAPTIAVVLGTTSSAVGVWQGGMAHLIPHETSGRRFTPSVVAFAKGGAVLVSEEALTPAPDAVTIVGAKRLLGRRFDAARSAAADLSWPLVENRGAVLLNVTTALVTPETVAALIVRELKQRAERFLNATVESAVVSVPASASEAQIRATVAAVRLAGLAVAEVVPETTAAAMAMARYTSADSGGNDRNMLVCDMGGGTLDVSLFKVPLTLGSDSNGSDGDDGV